MKSLWNLFKSLKKAQLKSLFLMFLKHPLMLFPTVWATAKCLKIVNGKFPKRHHLHNPENAYRHALWNALIIHYSLNRATSLDKAIRWAKKITDWHEDFSPNLPLQRAMDLHNNEIGRNFFLQLKKEKPDLKITVKVLLEALDTFLDTARKVSNEDEIKSCKSQFVYIND